MALATYFVASLNENTIGDDGAELLARSMSSMGSLTELQYVLEICFSSIYGHALHLC